MLNMTKISIGLHFYGIPKLIIILHIWRITIRMPLALYIHFSCVCPIVHTAVIRHRSFHCAFSIFFTLHATEGSISQVFLLFPQWKRINLWVLICALRQSWYGFWGFGTQENDLDQSGSPILNTFRDIVGFSYSRNKLLPFWGEPLITAIWDHFQWILHVPKPQKPYQDCPRGPNRSHKLIFCYKKTGRKTCGHRP